MNKDYIMSVIDDRELFLDSNLSYHKLKEKFQGVILPGLNIKKNSRNEHKNSSGLKMNQS